MLINGSILDDRIIVLGMTIVTWMYFLNARTSVILTEVLKQHGPWNFLVIIHI